MYIYIPPLGDIPHPHLSSGSDQTKSHIGPEGRKGETETRGDIYI
jgi:hypothetical protein